MSFNQKRLNNTPNSKKCGVGWQRKFRRMDIREKIVFATPTRSVGDGIPVEHSGIHIVDIDIRIEMLECQKLV
jgi:hypothetical protein